MKYQAESTHIDAKANKQVSDFYISVLDTTKDKCYLVPVSNAYQMQQQIKGFEKNFASAKDREFEDLTYFQNKQATALSFGTAKAVRKLQSLMTNKVEDEEGADEKKNSKGLKKMAKHVQEDIEEVRKSAKSAADRKKILYSREALMPEHIFADIPYSETYNALKTEDKDKLKELMCPFAVSIAMRTYA